MGADPDIIRDFDRRAEVSLIADRRLPRLEAMVAGYDVAMSANQRRLSDTHWLECPDVTASPDESARTNVDLAVRSTVVRKPECYISFDDHRRRDVDMSDGIFAAGELKGRMNVCAGLLVTAQPFFPAAEAAKIVVSSEDIPLYGAC